MRSSSSVVGRFFIGRSPRPSRAIDRLTTLYFLFHAPSPEGHTLPDNGPIFSPAVDAPLSAWLATDLMAASMSFPGIGPFRLAAHKEGQLSYFIDLVDGGLSDNLGVWTALDLLGNDGIADPHPRVLIIVDASTDAEAGAFTTASSVPTASAYLKRLPGLQLGAQYGEAETLVGARAKQIEATPIWLRLRAAVDDSIPLLMCNLEEFTDGVPAGSTPCKEHWEKTPGDFVRELTTSAALSPQHANGLMALGVRAVERAKPEILEALAACNSRQ